MTSRATFMEAERIRLERKRLERELTDAEIRQNATPQTIRNRRISVVYELFNRDKLTIEQLRAANEIHDILSSITRGLSVRTSSFEPRIRGGQFGDWKPGLVQGYHERYIPWRDEAGITALREKATIADLVLDMVISNRGLSQLAGLWRMDDRRVLGIIRTSLWRYCEIAGWVEVKECQAYLTHAK